MVAWGRSDAFCKVHRRRGRSAGPEGERGVSTPPSLPLDTPLPWTGCGSQRMLRPLSGPCILLATAPTTPPCFCRRQRSSSLQERGCSPLSDPKGVGSNRKYGRFTPFGVKIFSPYFRLPPIGKAPQSLRDSSPQGSGFRKSTYSRCAWTAGQAQQMQLPGTAPLGEMQLQRQMQFTVTAPPVKMQFRNARRRF